MNAARVGPLERLTYIGDSAMGAMTFHPVQPNDSGDLKQDVPLAQLAAEVQAVLSGEGGVLQKLLQMGGSPQGARPKVLLYRDPQSQQFTTIAQPGFEAWLVKFPAQREHPEVCAIEAVYAECLRRCEIDTPQTAWFPLPDGQAAFASKRFDRHDGLRVPMQSLAAFTGANYQLAGSLDYVNFLRATQICTNDVREKVRAFARVVFNVIFNNRDDHPKNFAYLMAENGRWTLAPAFDVTFNEGPGGYHQMDVMGEALDIGRQHLEALGRQEAELTDDQIDTMIVDYSAVGKSFSDIARARYPGQITEETLNYIQQQIANNMARLQR